MAKWVKIPKEELLRGLEEIEENLQNAVAEMKTTSRDGVIDAALFIATEAQKRAPIESGDLKNSAHVDLNGEVYASGEGLEMCGKIPDIIAEVTIGFSAPYAAAQHEHTEFDHPLGGQAKYLESVLVENNARILAAIAGKMSELFGGDKFEK